MRRKGSMAYPPIGPTCLLLPCHAQPATHRPFPVLALRRLPACLQMLDTKALTPVCKKCGKKHHPFDPSKPLHFPQKKARRCAGLL